ncbi:MAG: nucleotidyltransferase domain-containing protein [Defluviitaleaceae bacterium]|nr:nucleotidyltransferase domain-containing protein [Defluviitaleaceae bacterium]
MIHSIESVKKIIIPILNDSPIVRVIVFGSYARGEQVETSDIDMVIDSNGVLKGLDVFTWIHNIASVLPIPSDIYELREIKIGSNLQKIIQEEGVVIYDQTG